MIAKPLRRLTRRLRNPLRSRDDRQTLKDRALAHRLYATFERDLAMSDVRGLHFYVEGGVVTLYGTIRHELDHNLLLRSIRQVPGVKRIVTDKLEVGR